MKKHLVVFAVALLAVCIAAPAFADVEFKYGGQFRARFESENNVFDGTEAKGFYNNFVPFVASSSTYNSDDNRNFFDQRLRLYFTFLASKNLKVVTKFEIGDAVWGADPLSSVTGRVGANGGANLGADSVSIEVKNAYIEFNIPQTPTTAIVGVQTLTLLDSWIVDDDFAAAVLVTKLPPFAVTLGYVGGLKANERNVNGTQFMNLTDQSGAVDSMFVAADYKEGPFKASAVFFWQNAHKTNVSLDPATLSTPINLASPSGVGTGFFSQSGLGNGLTPFPTDGNNLFDFGVNFSYKVDWLLAYVNFVKNFGSVDLKSPIIPAGANGIITGPAVTSVDYTGFMVDAGLTYFCGPYTANVGGFYTTGPSISDVILNNGIDNGTTLGRGLPFKGTTSTDIEWFTYPLGTAKYSSEIIGGGVLGDDIHTFRGYALNTSAAAIGQRSGIVSPYWSGYQYPSNIWTVTAGGSWQVAPTTKISASYWYWGTSNSVPVAVNPADLTRYIMSDSIGHEFNFYLDQGIVDGLTLTLVGAYLVANDAFAPLPVGVNGASSVLYQVPHADDAYEFGARLQWNF